MKGEMKMKRTSKALSLLLALVMVFTSLPLAALPVLAAADDDTDLNIDFNYARDHGITTAADALAQELRERGAKAAAFDSYEAAMAAAVRAAGPSGAVCAFGSLYAAGAVRSIYMQQIGHAAGAPVNAAADML